MTLAGARSALLAALVILGALAAWVCFRLLADPQPDRQLLYRRFDGGELLLHIFNPAGERPAAGYPALLLFHGGGWRNGAARQFYPQCAALSRAGVFCASADYRIASRHGTKPSDAVEDAIEAFKLLRMEAARLGLDPARLFAGGGSSGGHLAAMLGSERVAPGSRPAGLVLYNPLLDLSPGLQGHDRAGPAWAAISPLHRLAAPVPRVLIMSGTADEEVAVSTLRRFCNRVTALGSDCRIELFEGARHGFFNAHRDPGAFARTNTLAGQFILSAD